MWPLIPSFDIYLCIFSLKYIETVSIYIKLGPGPNGGGEKLSLRFLRTIMLYQFRLVAFSTATEFIPRENTFHLSHLDMYKCTESRLTPSKIAPVAPFVFWSLN